MQLGLYNNTALENVNAVSNSNCYVTVIFVYLFIHLFFVYLFLGME